MQPLKPLQLNLQGQILIEASAGTGKTYTIALLFLRLLLERELSVDQILVVTFTRAATEELRGRVRQRIRDALDMLEGQNFDDTLLQEFIANITDRDRAKILLSDALTRMDEAAIFTIHGFCQRMLQEHAFESGAPFELEFLETEQLLRNRIMEDFWRLRFYKAPALEAAWVNSIWKSPQELQGSLGGHLSRADVTCIPEIMLEEIERQEAELVPLFAEAQKQWKKYGQEITELLKDNKRINRNNSNGYGLKRLKLAIEAMDRFTSRSHLPWQLDNLLELFTVAKISSSLKKNKHAPPEHSFFHFFTQFYQALQKLISSRKFAILTEARTYVHSELVRRKQEQAQLYFDDLLTHLDVALQDSGGRKLAAGITARFPIIMVDEFQDTDPLQYRIFAAIHANSSPQAGLFLIGDPKQAIYAFRGADIFTYIQARQDTDPKKQLTMDSNYRSTRRMVAAVNQLFHHDSPFLFAKKEIDFNPVKAAGMADAKPLLLDDDPLPALTCLLLPEKTGGKPANKGDAANQAAEFCAHEIGDLLAAGLSGQATIADHPLQAGDIAVLVRTHSEAELVRKALNRCAITSVSYSRESVYNSPEADQMLVVLTCLNDLADSGMIRTALAGQLFAYTAEQLDQLRSDEQQWETIINTMNRYRDTWQQEGFAPMFQKLLSEQRLVSRLHATTTGERVLTNFLHLSELLQGASREQTGSERLLRWFNDQRQAINQDTENSQLRLESDENLVKIVTIHKSKGMEYPVVFLPFLWSARPCNPKEPLAFHPPDSQNQLVIDMGTGSAVNFQLAEQERLAGDLRLLYVAITRARYSCFFCWGRIKNMQTTAFCYLLHGGQMPEDAATLATDLQSLHTAESNLAVRVYPEVFPRVKLESKKDAADLQVSHFKGRIDIDWRITSYSSLIAHHNQQAERPDDDQEVAEQPQVPGHDVFGFPKGAAAGICLHTILELIDFNDPAGHEEIISTQLAQAGFADNWLPVANDWMRDILHTPLLTEQNLSFSLADLGADDRVNEMSFYFPLQSMRLHRFNRALQEFSFAPLPNQDSILRGLMVGFIDLVFYHDGQYYVADYKSNHLGNNQEDYADNNLAAAMLDHRYDLQYLIYSLALHRFLAGRIEEYTYDTHFGGVLYLFLRGMNPKHAPGTGVFSACPPFALIDRLDKCCADTDVKML